MKTRIYTDRHRDLTETEIGPEGVNYINDNIFAAPAPFMESMIIVVTGPDGEDEITLRAASECYLTREAAWQLATELVRRLEGVDVEFNWLHAVFAVLPTAIGFIPGIPPQLVPVIVNGIHEAEQIQGASGEQKKQHVVQMVVSAINALNISMQGTASYVPMDAEALRPLVEQAIDKGVTVANVMSAEAKCCPPRRITPRRSCASPAIC